MVLRRAFEHSMIDDLQEKQRWIWQLEKLVKSS